MEVEAAAAAATMIVPAQLEPDVHPMRSLWLLIVAHAINHAQAAVLPLVYVVITGPKGMTGVDIPTIAYLVAAGNILSGLVQLSYSGLTRRFSRRSILGIGNLIFGSFMALMALATTFVPFAVTNIVSRIGGSPQHPVGNGLLAEQFPVHRRGFAISAHIAGGNVGSVMVPLVGAALIATVGWQGTVVVFGLPAVVIGVAMLFLIRESGTDRAAAIAHGSVRSAMRTVMRDRDLRLVFVSSILGGGARGLGVLNLFVPLYLARVLGFDDPTIALMLTVLLLGSVPGPLIAGWLSDRFGRKPMIVAIYLGGAVSLALFVLAGSQPALLWFGIVMLSIFNFVESPQLQALLGDISPPAIRDASFSIYFTLAFGVGSLWVAVYGWLVDRFGNAVGLPLVFWVMAVSCIAAAISVLPIHTDERSGGDVGPGIDPGDDGIDLATDLSAP